MSLHRTWRGFLWAKKTPPERGLYQLQVVEVVTQPSKGAIGLNHPQHGAKALPHTAHPFDQSHQRLLQ